MFNKLKADIEVFRIVRGKGFAKYLYYPDFKILLIFRLSNYLYKFKVLRPIAYLLVNLNDLWHGVWIGPRTTIGKGLSLSHPRGLIINPNTIIGDYCSIIQQVTIGGRNVVIGDYVEILAGAKIISSNESDKKLTVGDGAVIAAGAVVIDNVKNNSIVGGVPAKIIGNRNPNDNWSKKKIEI